MTLRILQVLPNLNSGGVEQGTLDLAKAIIARGHESFVVSGGGRLVDELTSHGSTHFSMNIGRKSPISAMACKQALKKLIVHHQIDIVHARSRLPAWIAFSASQSTNIHFVTTYHGAYSANNWLKKAYNQIMIKGKPTIAVSNFIAEHVSKEYPDCSAQIEIIRRGIEIGRLLPSSVPSERVEKTRLQWGISDKTPICLLPGRLTRIKGQDQIFSLLEQAQIENCQFVLAGDYDPNSSFVKMLQIKASQHARSVKIVGHCNDMPSAYAASDIVMLLTRKPESFGRVICEAQAAGKIVIATSHGGALETMATSMRKGLVRPNDSLDLKRALQWALSLSCIEKEKISNEALKHVEQNFTLEQMTQKTLDCYEHLVQPSLKTRL